MARISGIAGSVIIGTATVAGIKSWSMDYTYEMLDVSGFDSTGHKEFIAGQDSWSGSFEGFKDGAPLTIGAKVAVQLKESTTTGQVFTGSVLVHGHHPSVPVDGVIAYSYDFQGTGPLTIATA